MAPAMGGVERIEDMLRLDMETIDIVEPAVPGLRHNRQAPVKTARVRAALLDSPVNDGVAHDADTVRVGDRDRAFEESTFLQPGRPRHLAVAVETEDAGIDRIVVFSPRQDRGHAGADRALADFDFSFAADQRRVADLNASDVGDRVERARGAVEGNAEGASADGLRRRRGGLRLAGERDDGRPRKSARTTRRGMCDSCEGKTSNAATPNVQRPMEESFFHATQSRKSC